jgi:eukaryotic-like serine/threonine-protein kinase
LLTPGTRLGPYEVVARIGAGGMGQVYRARDTRLERDVAIKVLPPDVAAGADRLRRFELEARAVASLHHPNILAVYDIGYDGPMAASSPSSGISSGEAPAVMPGAPYMVTELLEGETLRFRLDRGPLPFGTAVDYAAQIARGLAAAHDKHLVHRDLKPANVFLTAGGGVKILDFGLAKVVSRAPASGTSETEPGVTAMPISAETEAGVVLGTVGYMAPEQVRGLPADHRADIFALGTVIYEMLTGRRAFDGDTTADVMTAILKDDPPELPAAVRQGTPALCRIVERCVAKDPSARFASASDLAFALEGLTWSGLGPAPDGVAAARPSRRLTPRLAMVMGVVAGALVAAALLAPWWRGATATGDEPAIHLQLTLPIDLTPVRGQPPAVSPDGTRVALVGVDHASGLRQIYLRPLNSLSAQSVRGTERAIFPFWSADAGKIGFFADGRLKTVDLEMGAVQDVCAAPNPAGPGIWVDDTIVFPRNGGPVHRVSASGGTSVPATPFDAHSEVAQSVAGFLADRTRFVFGTNAFGSATLRIGSRDGAVGAPLQAPAARGELHTPWLRNLGTEGHLLFLRGSALLAVGFDGSTAEVVGDPVPLAQSVAPLSSGSAQPFSVQDAVLAYVGDSNGSTRLVWMDRRGQALGTVGSVGGFIRDVRISRDGALLSVSRFNETDRVYDLMLLDLRRPTATQLTYGTSAVQSSWLPDGSAIIFSNVTAKGAMLVRIPAREGAAVTPIVVPDEGIVTLSEPSPDGRTVAYARIRPDGDSDLYLHRLDQEVANEPFLATPAFETGLRFAPDGKRVAYQSNETGVPEVFIRSFPDGTDKLQVSQGGGYRPVWSHDGRELFYLSGDGDMMAVAVTVAPTLTAAAPQRLFRTAIDPGGASIFYQFDVHPDGRFAVVVPETDAPQPFNIILNWQTLLRK